MKATTRNWKRPLRRAWALAALAVVAFSPPSWAQDSPLTARPAGTRSSPFDPPRVDVFVTDQGPGLDTGCTFNDDPNHPLVIDVLVDRAVGPVDANGYLLNPGQLIADGVVPAAVEVILPAFDVDVNGAPPPEVDQLRFNGNLLGTLSGDNNIWKLNSFRVPVSQIRFPAPAWIGPPTPVANRIQINVDLLATGRWCTSVDWVALVLPIRLRTALTLEPDRANPIRVREYGVWGWIETIYEETFDAACGVTNQAASYDDFPFSGAALSGSVRLEVDLAQCPANPQHEPAVQVDWRITGPGVQLTGLATWSGSEGAIDLTLPRAVGIYDTQLTFRIDGRARPPIHRKLLVTHAEPLGFFAPRLGWYELATAWAAGQADEAAILRSLLGGLYRFGQGNWRYGYGFGSVGRCSWDDLVETPIQCDYADCHIFSEVFEELAGVLGVGGLASVVPTGSRDLGFLTTAAPSLDPAFPGSARRVESESFDRYLFANHSLRLKNGRYYDATFDGLYTTADAFISANLDGTEGTDAQGPYAGTVEGWRIYDLGTSVYDGWGAFAYRQPVAAPNGPAASPAATTRLEFPGGVTFSTPDEDLDGLAERLVARVPVRLNATGQYVIRGRLTQSGQLVADLPFWESMQFVRVPLEGIPGSYTVTLELSGEQIRRFGQNGPYTLELTGLAPDGLVTASSATPAFSFLTFGEEASALSGLSEMPVDADGDGRFEAVELHLTLDVRRAAELRLQGALSKGEATLTDAALVQSLAPGLHPLTLRLEGAALARAALDGPYSATVALFEGERQQLASVQMATRAYRATDFALFATAQGPIVDQGVDPNGNGLFDLLQVDFALLFAQPGAYRVTGSLGSPGSPSAVFGEATITATSGLTSVRLEFAGGSIAALDLDGPYTVNLVVRDASSAAIRDSLRLATLSGSYVAADFEPFGTSNQPIRLTGRSTDAGVDLDGDGLFDRLRVGVEVSLARGDLYEWSARLVDAQGAEIGFFTQRRTLPAGLAELSFDFAAAPIAKNGSSGPYQVKSLLIFGQAGDNLVSVDVAQTQAHPISAFDGAGDFDRPQIVTVPGPLVLWPPDGRLETFEVDDLVVAVSDATDTKIDASSVVITEVTSDEAGGSADIVLAVGCRGVELRAQRDGGGNGRVYIVRLGVSDASGNVGTAQVQIVVPLLPGGPDPIADGPALRVEGCKP